MVTLDRIRLTGLLRREPRQRGSLYHRRAAGDPLGLAPRRPGCGLRGTARRRHPARFRFGMSASLRPAAGRPTTGSGVLERRDAVPGGWGVGNWRST